MTKEEDEAIKQANSTMIDKITNPITWNIRGIHSFTLPQGAGVQYWDDKVEFYTHFRLAKDFIVDKDKNVFIGTMDGIIHVLMGKTEQGEILYG